MTASFKGLCLGIKGSLYKPVAGCYLAFRGFLPPALPETKDLSGQPLGVGRGRAPLASTSSVSIHHILDPLRLDSPRPHSCFDPRISTHTLTQATLCVKADETCFPGPHPRVPTQKKCIHKTGCISEVVVHLQESLDYQNREQAVRQAPNVPTPIAIISPWGSPP